jgi:hypothetical protein
MFGPLVVTAMLATATSVRVQPFIPERYYETTTPDSGYTDHSHTLFRNGSNPLSHGSNRARIIYEVDGVLVQPFNFQSNTVETSNIDKSLSLQTTSEKLNVLKSDLGLSMTQLAELFGVTRKTIYDWYDGVEPRAAAINKIAVILHLLSNRPQGVDVKVLKTVWKIPVSGSSFLGTFHSDVIDDGQLAQSLSLKLRELSDRLTTRSGHGDQTAYRLAKNNLSEYERHADFG